MANPQESAFWGLVARGTRRSTPATRVTPATHLQKLFLSHPLALSGVSSHDEPPQKSTDVRFWSRYLMISLPANLPGKIVGNQIEVVGPDSVHAWPFRGLGIQNRND